MSAPEVKTQSKPRVAHPAFSKFKKEDWAMRFAGRIAKVNIPVKVLVGLAAGAMLITATAFTYHEVGQGKPGSTSYGEGSEVWGGSGLPDTPYYTNPDYRESELGQGKAGSPTSSSDTTQGFRDSAYLGSQDPEVVEKVLDEVRAAFVGIGSPNGAITQAFPDTLYYQDPDWRERHLSERGVSDQGFQDSAYLGSQDPEAVERVLDEVRAAWTGVAS